LTPRGSSRVQFYSIPPEKIGPPTGIVKRAPLHCTGTRCYQ